MKAPRRGDASSDTEQLLYTAAEAAGIVSLTPYWLTTNARRGRIPHRRIGRLYRFAREDLEEIKEMAARPVTTRAGRRRSA